MIPTREEAHHLLTEAEGCNPGPWAPSGLQMLLGWTGKRPMCWACSMTLGENSEKATFSMYGMATNT